MVRNGPDDVLHERVAAAAGRKRARTVRSISTRVVNGDTGISLRF
jgi:hypothetical protein